jgi:hypothetical protein
MDVLFFSSVVRQCLLDCEAERSASPIPRILAVIQGP